MRKVAAFATTTMVTAGIVLAGYPALGVADQQAPSLTVPIKPSFIVGSVLNDPSGPPRAWSSFPLLLEWSASDNVGVCQYRVDSYIYAGDTGTILSSADATSLVIQDGDYNGDEGDRGGVTAGWTITASDCARNATTKWVPNGEGQYPSVVMEEDGIAGGGRVVGPSEAILSYQGTWGTANCVCFSGGHTRRTSSANAKASFTRTFQAGDHVAIVMAKGPGRGRASIRIDNVLVTTIDTFASVNTNRVVVFERMMTAGTHTVTVVNLATTGRARIDLDAVMFN